MILHILFSDHKDTHNHLNHKKTVKENTRAGVYTRRPRSLSWDATCRSLRHTVSEESVGKESVEIGGTDHIWIEQRGNMDFHETVLRRRLPFPPVNYYDCVGDCLLCVFPLDSIGIISVFCGPRLIITTRRGLVSIGL